MRRRVLCSALACWGMFSSAEGSSLTRGVRDYTVIQDGSGSARVLFKMEAASDLDTSVIGRATLTFNVSGAAEDRVIRLRAHPVTTSWSAGAASWAVNFDDRFFTVTEVDLSRGSSTVSIDLAPFLKEVHEEGATTDGFLLTVDPADGDGLKAADVTRFQGLSTASIDVYYRRIGRRAGRS